MGGLNYSEAGFRIFWEFYVDLFKFDFADFFPPLASSENRRKCA